MNTPDITGILDTIDHAIADYDSSPDAMRWVPPTVTATFVYGQHDDDGGSAIFPGVREDSLDRVQVGTRVWFDGRLYLVRSRQDAGGQVFIDLGSPVTT